MNLSLLAASNNGVGSAFLIALYLLVLFVCIAGLWKTFQKAGKPGWGAIIPIYNAYLILKMAGRPGWWLLLYLVPFVNIVIQIIVAIDVAKAFKKSTAFGVIGLWLFNVIGYIILGFGDAKYAGAPKY